MKRFLAGFRAIFFLFLIACETDQQDELMTYSLSEGSAWRLALQPDGLVYGTFEGDIFARNLLNNNHNWRFTAGAFPFGLKAADLDLDGKFETLAALADGRLIVLDHQGKLLWEFRSDLPLFNVDAGDIIPGAGLEVIAGGIDRKVYLLNSQGQLLAESEKMERVVHRLAAGNLDQDPEAEILVIENRTIANLLEPEGNRLVSRWRKPLKAPEEFVNWENPNGNLYVFDLKLRDLDGDGIDEILTGDTYFNKQSVAVLDHRAEPKWISERQPFFAFQEDPDRYTEFYSAALVEAAELRPDLPGKEVISLAGGLMKIFDANGNKLAESAGKIGFSDLVMKGSVAILGSSPNGDNTIYQVDLGGAELSVFENLNRQNLALQIGENLEQVRQKVLDLPAEPENRKPFTFAIHRFDASEAGLNRYQQELEFNHNQFPYENLNYLTSIKIIEPEPPLDENGQPWSPGRWRTDAINGTMTVDEILEKARFIEENKIPTLFYIGHSCMPFITLETAEKILQTAPNYCKGFRSAEDEALERLDRYFPLYYEQLSELCLKYGASYNLTKNKGTWWVSSPSMKPVYQSIFGDRRHEVAVASTEDSNSRTPELNILGRSGLWLAGLLKHNEINLNSDLFSFDRFFQWEYPKHGHPYLRRLIAHTLLGGNWASVRYMDKMETDSGFVFNQMGRESTEIFYHLLGKGLLFTPEPEQVRGFSSVGIVMHHPSQKWLRDAYNGHSPEIWEPDPELDSAVIPHNGNLWGLSPTPGHALQHVLFNKKQQFGMNIPPTPYGLVAFVPVHTNLTQVAGIREWWHTDGIYLWQENGPKLTGSAAARALQSSFKKAAADLLFRPAGDDVFLQVVQLDDKKYRLFLVDPGWMDPQNRQGKITSRKLKMKQIDDRLQNLQLNTTQQESFEFKLPAGSFGIIDVLTE